MEAVSLDITDTPPVPVHVAIIMDGNGRWAKARGLPRTVGHRQGAESVRRAVESSVKLGIRYLTLYGFSSENWKRPASEVKDLMGLLRVYLKSEVSKLHKQGVQFRIIGDRSSLADDIVELIEGAEKKTSDNTTLTLTIALSYGGRAEISDAARRIAEDVLAGKLDAQSITEESFEGYLYTHDIPDPDLLIRTSGEQRISNFLLWQLAYAEFVFIDTLWPEFSFEDMEQAVQDFQCRERRYGNAGG